MKRMFLILNFIFSITLLTNCASTPKEPRSIKATANTIANKKAVKAIIDNYDMELIYDYKKESFNYMSSPFGEFKITEVIIAQNKKNDEAIVYASFENPSKERIRFAYLAINCEKTSTVKYDGNSRDNEYHKATVYLDNNSTCCNLDNKIGYGVLIDPNNWIKGLINIRETVEFIISQNFAFTFEEEINPKQLELLNK